MCKPAHCICLHYDAYWILCLFSSCKNPRLIVTHSENVNLILNINRNRSLLYSKNFPIFFVRIKCWIDWGANLKSNPHKNRILSSKKWNLCHPYVHSTDRVKFHVWNSLCEIYPQGNEWYTYWNILPLLSNEAWQEREKVFFAEEKRSEREETQTKDWNYILLLKLPCLNWSLSLFIACNNKKTKQQNNYSQIPTVTIENWMMFLS